MVKNTKKQPEYDKVRLKNLETEIKICQDRITQNAEEKIKIICEENNLFCGVVINQDILLQLIKMALDTRENIKIPFKIYFKTNNDGSI